MNRAEEVIQRLEKELNNIQLECNVLLIALGTLVSKPTPFCDDGVCPYCDCMDHPDDCEWLRAQHLWVSIKNRHALP